MEILHYRFMQNAILAALLGGVACSTIGVFVVTMGISFIGICISHAAFAGALLGILLGFDPLVGAFVFSLLAAAVIGPLADRGEFNPDTAIGIVFSLMLGLAFLFMGLMVGPRTQALGLLWGSILTVTDANLILLAAVCGVVVILVLLFYKEIQAVLFHREMALAVGIPANAIFYALLFLTGATITASFKAIGGLLIFSLIINPAAAAYQLTYSLKRLFLLSALFGVLSGWMGLLASYLFDVPSGAVIIIVSSLVFAIATLVSPKRKVKRWPAIMNHRQFFDQAAAEWDALEVDETLIRLREIVAGLDFGPGAAVLDVGCGTGILFPLLLEAMNGAGRVVGLDISGEMLRCAQAKGHPVECVQGDAQSLPLSDESFDWVICNAVFPHFPDKLRALGEICRVLRSGGRLVICHTASRQAINEFHRSMGGVVAHDTIPDEGEMLRLLEEAGLMEAQVWDEPDCYLILAHRNQRRSRSSSTTGSWPWR